MSQIPIQSIDPQDLAEFSSRHKETDYMLVDVRQTQEYTQERRCLNMENKVATKENLIKRILEVRERLSSFDVTSIGLFGSFVR